MPGANEAKCTCPKKDCERHGDCIPCVMHHRKPEIGNIVHCLREKAMEIALAEVKARAQSKS